MGHPSGSSWFHDMTSVRMIMRRSVGRTSPQTTTTISSSSLASSTASGSCTGWLALWSEPPWPPPWTSWPESSRVTQAAFTESRQAAEIMHDEEERQWEEEEEQEEANSVQTFIWVADDWEKKFEFETCDHNSFDDITMTSSHYISCEMSGRKVHLSVNLNMQLLSDDRPTNWTSCVKSVDWTFTWRVSVWGGFILHHRRRRMWLHAAGCCLGGRTHSSLNIKRSEMKRSVCTQTTPRYKHQPVWSAAALKPAVWLWWWF